MTFLTLFVEAYHYYYVLLIKANYLIAGEPVGEHLAIATSQIWNPRTTSQTWRQPASHSRGRPMAHGFSHWGAMVMIPRYGSGMHRPGSRLATLGLAIPT